MTAETVNSSAAGPPAKASLLYNPQVRSGVFQLVLGALVIWGLYSGYSNAVANLQAQKIASGFGFLNNTAGFGISQTLIEYNEASTYGRAFVVSLLNTLLVAVIGIFFATIFGFLVGVARLSSNWVISRIAYWYVEVIRNLPLLFQILFWYLAVLAAMPNPRQSLSIFGIFFVNNRGIILPKPVFGEGTSVVLIALGVAIVVSLLVKRWAKQRQIATGQQFPVGWTALGLIIGLPFLTLAALGFPVTFELPELRGFNFVGGARVIPEFIALLVALVAYTAAFIGEIVRAGIMAVSHGQTEAAYSLGLRPGPTLRLVVIPQAMRVIIPPLTSQYLNLTKNSSLAAGVGYPELVSVFAGTVLNQTGQAFEVLGITMACYLTTSLITSIAMNWYNNRVALIER